MTLDGWRPVGGGTGKEWQGEVAGEGRGDGARGKQLGAGEVKPDMTLGVQLPCNQQHDCSKAELK